MDEQEWRTRARSYGPVAAAYAAHRPSYPADAVRWLVGERPARILELGAGTGKLTATLCELGHDVVATDPQPEMLAELRRGVPMARPVLAKAENIPFPSSSVDVVIAGQAFHWFDQDRALPEIARVLRPGGTVALVWNTGDARVPWVRKVNELIGHQADVDGTDPFVHSDIFVTTERTSIKHWQPFRKDTLIGFVESTSHAAVLNASEAADLRERAGQLYDSYERGPDGLMMPWVAHCYRGRVAGLASTPLESLPANADDETVVISFS
jgi:SAM-dependent methyltransferase